MLRPDWATHEPALAANSRLGSYCRTALLVVAACLVDSRDSLAQEPTADSQATDVAEFFASFCLDCHSGTDAERGVRLDELAALPPGQAQRSVWRDVLTNVELLRMPPADAEQPSDEARTAMLAAIRAGLRTLDCSGPRDPGRVPPRRLSRSEYRHTIRDLVGVDFRAARDFPGDDIGNGFDNQAATLSLSPLLMEKYLVAAEGIADRAMGQVEGGFEMERLGSELKGDPDYSEIQGNRQIIFSPGSLETTVTIETAGDFRWEVIAEAEHAGPNWPELGFIVDGHLMEKQPLRQPNGVTQELTWNGKLAAGSHTLGVAFLNDYFMPEATDPAQRDRNLIVHEIRLRGPFKLAPGTPPSMARLLGRGSFLEPFTTSDRRRMVRNVLSRAYRRPTKSTEVDRVLQWLAGQPPHDRSDVEDTRKVLLVALTSPRFIFRAEPDPPDLRSVGVRDLDDFELASRLSYFLWSSMPSERLFSLARRGELHTPDQLRRAARNMLKSPRSVALVTNFADQWLQLRRLDGLTKDEDLFPDFDDELVRAMRTETQLFFASLIQEDRSVLDLVDAEYTFVNRRLARWYDLPEVPESGFHRISLAGTPRGGVLTQASILTLTSRPTRTSPVMRGKWILEGLLNDPPPPPDPGVAQLDERRAPTESEETLRQQLERHRTNPQCAGCHARMDALGFALENFDSIGRYRDSDRGQPLDTMATLPDGSTLNGAHDLKRALRGQYGESIVRGLVERVFVYALGRGVEDTDECTIREIVTAVRDQGDRFSSIVEGIVVCDAFRRRRVD